VSPFSRLITVPIVIASVPFSSLLYWINSLTFLLALILKAASEEGLFQVFSLGGIVAYLTAFPFGVPVSHNRLFSFPF